MDPKDIRNLQEAYSNVYRQEVDEATKMAKLGYDEVDIRNKIADRTIKANTRAGRTVDKANALEDKPTYGDDKKKEGREKHARAQRGTFHSTNSSNPGLHGNPYNANKKPSESDPNTPERVRELQGVRGKQRARVGLTPNERKLYTSYEYDRFDTILEYLISEGYADTNENALVIMANMSEDWKYSILEDVRGGPSFSSNPIIDAGKKIVGGILDRYRNGPSKEPNIPQKPESRDEPLWDGPNVHHPELDGLPTKPQPKPKPGPVLRNEPLF